MNMEDKKLSLLSQQGSLGGGVILKKQKIIKNKNFVQRAQNVDFQQPFLLNKQIVTELTFSDNFILEIV